MTRAANREGRELVVQVETFENSREWLRYSKLSSDETQAPEDSPQAQENEITRSERDVILHVEKSDQSQYKPYKPKRVRVFIRRNRRLR